MKYFINGDEVSERTFERETEDNYNLDIEQIITESGDRCELTYKDEV